MRGNRISLLLVFLLCGVLMLSACGGGGSEAEPAEAESTAQALENCGIIHEPEFGGVFIKNSIDEFNALGYQYGDSVDVSFSNGYKCEDIPYYNGYYVKNGETLLVGYPGYEYIKVCVMNGDDLWETAGLEDGMTATISLHAAGTYAKIQNMRNIQYKDDRDYYDSDEIFANFRAVDVSTMKENTIYRSASPCDNDHNRATYVDKLMKDAGMKYILNLADSDEQIKEHMNKDSFDSPYFAELYEAGNVAPVDLNANYDSDDYRQKLAAGLTDMVSHEGPYLVHCTEGKDRTGFACMLLEALSGAGWDEIEKDYMITYSNYYGITKESDPEKYDVIVEELLVPMVQSLIGDEEADVRTTELSGCAEKLLADAGMKADDIEKLKAEISK